jgi:DNA replication and repair protein RecF
MYLTHLSLTNYRAFTRLDLDIPRRVLVLVGANAQGKTSLLEAIYYLATFTSLHAASDRQLINFVASGENLPGHGTAAPGLAVARIVAEYHRAQRSHRMEVRLILENAGNGGTRMRKEILLDGVRRKANDALGHFTAVIFLPQMTRILENGPDERRRYLNLALSQAIPGYAQALIEYAEVVTQRNALLKLLNERGGDPDQLCYWNELLVDKGSTIIHARIAAIQEMEKLAARLHQQLTSGSEVLRLLYQPAYDPLPAPANGQITLPLRQIQAERSNFTREQIRKGFLERLGQARAEEINRGVTTIGPHRDELRFISSGVDLGDYGSRGQVRTTLLSLKLAEVAWLKEKTGQWPVLLLDEVLAELDLQRRADLLAAVAESEQAVVTATDLNMFAPDFLAESTVWKVNAGQVEE